MRDIVSLLQRPSETTEDLAQRLRHIAGRMLTGIAWTFSREGLRDLPPQKCRSRLPAMAGN